MSVTTPLTAVRLGFRWLLLFVLIAALIERCLMIGPTIGDDVDPEGNVSAAFNLYQAGALVPSRRLPGYPMMLLGGHFLLPFSLPWNMFLVHMGLTAAFALATTLFVWRVIGFAVAAVYLAIMAINSHFVRNAVVMFADLPHTVLFYLAVGAAALFVMRTSAWRWAWFGAFLVLALAAYLMHPSGDIRLQFFIWAAIFVYALRGLVTKTLRARLPLLASLVLLSVGSFAMWQATQRLFQLQSVSETVDIGTGFQSSTEYLRAFLAYRMLLCLPPPREASPLDAAIEERKAALARRQGYPTEAIVPPGIAREFDGILRGGWVPVQGWHQRLRENPLTLVHCAIGEMRAKWHYLVRNLTPFTTFATDKTFITPEYPPQTQTWRDRIFWTTGLSLFRVRAADDPDHHIEAAAMYDAMRCIVVLAMIVWGLGLIDRRWPLLGTIFLLGTLAWFVLLSFIVPLETRYFMPNMPVIYLAQAMVVVTILRTILMLPYWTILGSALLLRDLRPILAQALSRLPRWRATMLGSRAGPAPRGTP